MASINRLAKFFADAAACNDYRGELPAPPDGVVSEIEKHVLGLIENCRERQFDDAQLARVFTVCIVRIVMGGNLGR
jgi:hypothetical protein